MWFVTVEIKSLCIKLLVGTANRSALFLKELADLTRRGIQVRLIRAKEPGPNWREDFDRYLAR